MAADKRRPGIRQNIHRARHHMEQCFFDLRFRSERHGRNGKSGLRLRPHRKYITERMIGRHLAENIWVVDKRAEEIDRVHHNLAGRHFDDRRVIRFIQSNQNIWSLDRLQHLQGTAENIRPNFGAATAAALQ